MDPIEVASSESAEEDQTKPLDLDEHDAEPRACAMILVKGRFLGRTISIPAGGMVVGRGDECDLVIGSARDGTSRQHARLYFEGKDLRVEDLGSTNGLFVNQLHCRKTRLSPGDLLQIGDSVFKIVGDGDEIRYHEAMYTMAVRDAVTGLFNRTHLDATMTSEIKRSQRYGHPLSVLLLDLDHFKKVNDRYGHVAGDNVLMQLGQLLLNFLRVHDLPCRYGGEEFLLLLPETDLEGALTLAERCRMTIMEHRFESSGTLIELTVSIGLACLEPGADADRLIKAADQALYQAKRDGRNCVVVGRPDQEAASEQLPSWQRDGGKLPHDQVPETD